MVSINIDYTCKMYISIQKRFPVRFVTYMGGNFLNYFLRAVFIEKIFFVSIETCLSFCWQIICCTEILLQYANIHLTGHIYFSLMVPFKFIDERWRPQLGIWIFDSKLHLSSRPPTCVEHAHVTLPYYQMFPHGSGEKAVFGIFS